MYILSQNMLFIFLMKYCCQVLVKVCVFVFLFIENFLKMVQTSPGHMRKVFPRSAIVGYLRKHPWCPLISLQAGSPLSSTCNATGNVTSARTPLACIPRRGPPGKPPGIATGPGRSYLLHWRATIYEAIHIRNRVPRSATHRRFLLFIDYLQRRLDAGLAQVPVLPRIVVPQEADQSWHVHVVVVVEVAKPPANKMIDREGAVTGGISMWFTYKDRCVYERLTVETGFDE